jgi:putative PIN family toxin of toxin-antitoxin system
MRAVIDTNVWVSALLTPHGYPAQVVKAFRDGLFEAVVSEPLLNEIEAVLLRPRIVKKYPVDEATVREYLALLRSRSLLIEITGIMKMCRDPRDDFLIEMALWGWGRLHCFTRRRLET